MKCVFKRFPQLCIKYFVVCLFVNCKTLLYCVVFLFLRRRVSSVTSGLCPVCLCVREHCHLLAAATIAVTRHGHVQTLIYQIKCNPVDVKVVSSGYEQFS